MNRYLVREAFYGKKKELEECETLITEILEKANKSDMELNKLKEKRELEEKFEKLFNIQRLHIALKPSDMFGAHTYAYSLGFLGKGENGRSNLSKVELYISIPIEQYMLIYNLTSGEIVALILHEIGHSLYRSLFNLLSKLPYVVMNPIGFLTTPRVTHNLSSKLRSQAGEFIGNVNNKFKDVKNFIFSVEATKEIMGHMSYILNTVNGANIALAIGALINALINPRFLFGYKNEIYSDSVATTYGYGPELASALTKITNADAVNMVRFNKKGKVTKQLVKRTPVERGVIYLYREMLFLYLKPHPATVTRVNKQLQKCKREIQDPNLDPQLRKKLKEDISELEKILNDNYLNEEKLKKEGREIEFMINNFFVNITKGKFDIRELLVSGKDEM